ncbi:PE family protein [Mycolicibacterium wolinskyi]|uniref:PE domain-containing protein n=1 Tax=Mycolicibacterium wolinskyi TaxID=59750 RepID=A0A1X2FFN5_9MYCO|nr:MULTISPECIES: PE family protein [Mycolicibacterium]MCV7290840.1 PE family protein [Mycolicibacterium wolinskyi]MCV7291107.1 PE family protein [Mycolicibacterium goodii]ORX17253.1 hypothetical protein AWC31_18220 [Mycolicibacterium wolinskyi]
MADSQGLSIRTRELGDAATRLDAIADRLESLLRAEEPQLNTVPVGRDEVSVRASSTLNEVHTSYAKSAALGVTELREVAAALRSSAGNVAAADAEFTV